MSKMLDALRAYNRNEVEAERIREEERGAQHRRKWGVMRHFGRKSAIVLCILVGTAAAWGVRSALKKVEWGSFFGGKNQTATSTTTTGVTADGEHEVKLVTANPKAVFTIPTMHRWEMLDPVPDTSTWRMEAHRDRFGNRIQTFELVPPATAVEFKIVVSRCASVAGCAW